MGLFDILSKKTGVQYFSEGINFINLNQYAEAITSFDKAIAIEPDYSDAWIYRGIALGELGRYSEAVVSYNKAIAIKPDFALAWSWRGRALKELNRYEEAVAAFDRAIQLDPLNELAISEKNGLLSKKPFNQNNRGVKVKEIMTQNPIVVSGATTIAQIEEIFSNNKIWSIYVGDPDNYYIGIITRDDLKFRAEKKKRSAPAYSIMSKGVISIDENADVEDAKTLIYNKKINGLAVTRNGKHCGIITRYDIKNKQPKSSVFSQKETTWIDHPPSSLPLPRPPHSGLIWTDKDIQLLIQFWDEGKSIQIIANLLKRSPEAIVHSLIDTGLIGYNDDNCNPRPARFGFTWSNQEKTQLTTEFKAGKSIPEIANIHQRNMNAILRSLVKLQIIDYNDRSILEKFSAKSALPNKNQPTPILKETEIESPPQNQIKLEPPQVNRAYEFYAGYIRVKISVKNPTSFTIHDVILDPDVDRAILYLERHEPEEYPSENEKIRLGTIYPHNDRTVSLYLEPCICLKTDVHCHIRYKDAQGQPGSLDMEPLRIQVVCPIFDTKEPVNIGMLKQLIETLPSQDTKVFSVPKNLDAQMQLKLFQSVIQLHDIRHISTLRRMKNYESWYYGRTKVLQKDMVIKLGVVKDMDMVEITAFSYDSKDLTGLLAEINRHVTEEVSKRENVQKILNISIKDSVLQRTNLMSFCDADGKCSGDVTIEDSVVMRSNILSPNHENPEDVVIPKANDDVKILSPTAHDLEQSLKENSTSITKNAINSEKFQPVTSMDNQNTEEMHDKYARKNGVYPIYQFLKTNCKTLFPTYTIEGRSINFRANKVLGYQIIDAFNIFPRLSDQNKGLKFQAYTYVLADFFNVAPESIKASLPQDSEEWHWQGKNTDDASGLQGHFGTIDDTKKFINLLSKKKM
jgi:tetratricopeptide (TPR) repeat protein